MLGRIAILLVAVGCGSGTDVGTAPATTPNGGTLGGETNPTGGSWSETNWCSSLSDLSAIEAAHTPGTLRQTLVDVSAARYPPGVGFIDAQSDSELQIWFFGGTDTFDGVMDGYEVAVHEGAHIWGFQYFGFDSYSYRIVDDDHIIDTLRLDNFPRSEILTRHPYPNDDFYADTYLTGQSGSQGFNTVLDEFNAYGHSLVSRYCTRDTLSPGSSTSARDGLLTFMLYVELYLKIAREEHPSDYDAILADGAQVQVILDVWDRAEHWLAITESESSLGIEDAFIAGHVYDPANLEEITRLR